jgi:hypothetical protein
MIFVSYTVIFDLQSNLELFIVALICCENKGANSTRLKQLTLKVSNDSPANRRCHPVPVMSMKL